MGGVRAEVLSALVHRGCCAKSPPPSATPWGEHPKLLCKGGSPHPRQGAGSQLAVPNGAHFLGAQGLGEVPHGYIIEQPCWGRGG